MQTHSAERSSPGSVLPRAAVANRTVNRLMLRNTEGADGKAMVRRTDPPVLLVPREGGGAVEGHLQGEQQTDEEQPD